MDSRLGNAVAKIQLEQISFQAAVNLVRGFIDPNLEPSVAVLHPILIGLPVMMKLDSAHGRQVQAPMTGVIPGRVGVAGTWGGSAVLGGGEDGHELYIHR